jgi:hypothetical protein
VIKQAPVLTDGLPFLLLPANRLFPVEQMLPPAGFIPVLLLKNVLPIIRATPAFAVIPTLLPAKRTLKTLA